MTAATSAADEKKAPPRRQDRPLVLVLCGPPASGKGTQAQLLSQRLDAPTVSTGRLIRQQQRLGTDIGQLADEHLGRGGLLPDEPTQQLLGEWLDQGHQRMILDGFPRNITQARWLDQALQARGLQLDAVVWLQVPEQVLIERTRCRWTCFACGHSAIGPASNQHPPACERCGAAMERRRDDDPDMLAQRLQAWNSVADELRSYYQNQGRLLPLQARGEALAAHHDLMAQLELLRDGRSTD